MEENNLLQPITIKLQGGLLPQPLLETACEEPIVDKKGKKGKEKLQEKEESTEEKPDPVLIFAAQVQDQVLISRKDLNEYTKQVEERLPQTEKFYNTTIDIPKCNFETFEDAKAFAEKPFRIYLLEVNQLPQETTDEPVDTKKKAKGKPKKAVKGKSSTTEDEDGLVSDFATEQGGRIRWRFDIPAYKMQQLLFNDKFIKYVEPVSTDQGNGNCAVTFKFTQNPLIRKEWQNDHAFVQFSISSITNLPRDEYQNVECLPPFIRSTLRGETKDIPFQPGQDVRYVSLIETNSIDGLREFFENDVWSLEIHDRDRRLPTKLESDLSYTEYYGAVCVPLDNFVYNNSKTLKQAFLLQPQFEDKSVESAPQEAEEVPDAKASKKKDKKKVEEVPEVEEPEYELPTVSSIKAASYVSNRTSIKLSIRLSHNFSALGEDHALSSLGITTTSHKLANFISSTIEKYEPSPDFNKVEEEIVEDKKPKKPLKGKKAVEPEKEESSSVELTDTLSGYHVWDQSIHIFYVEGLLHFGLKNIVAQLLSLNQNENISILFNDKISYGFRKYDSMHHLVLQDTLTNLLRTSSTFLSSQRDGIALEGLSKLSHYMEATSFRKVIEQRLFLSKSELSRMSELYSTNRDDDPSNQIKEADEQVSMTTKEEDIKKVDQEENSVPDALTKDNISRFLNQKIIIEGIAQNNPPRGYPNANVVLVAGEQKRLNERCGSCNPTDNDIEKKLYFSISPNNVYVVCTFPPDISLPPLAVRCQIEGSLKKTKKRQLFAVVVDHVCVNSRQRGVDHKQTLKLKRKKVNFHTQNLSAIESKSNALKEKRLAANPPDPLMQQVKDELIELAGDQPFMYAGQKLRWSELQKEAMRRVLHKATKNRKVNFSFGQFQSQAYSVMPDREELPASSTKKSKWVYPGNTKPGEFTKPTKQLHPSRIKELESTQWRSSNAISKMLEHNSDPLPPSQQPFQNFVKSKNVFSETKPLGFGSGSAYVSPMEEAEAAREKANHEWQSRVVVDDPNFHVDVRSDRGSHPIDKRNSLLHGKPKRKDLKFRTLSNVPHSITSTGPYVDPTKKPFNLTMQTGKSRTKLPVFLGQTKGDTQFYIPSNSASLSKTHKRRHPPLSSHEKSGPQWGDR